MKLFYYNKFINSRTGSRIHSRAFIKEASSKMKSNFSYYPSISNEQIIVEKKQKKIPYRIKIILIIMFNLLHFFSDFSILKKNYNQGFELLVRYDLFNFSILKASKKFEINLEVNSPMYEEFPLQSGLIYKMLKRYEINLWKKSKKIIAVSTIMKKKIINYGIAEDKIFVVPNGADIISTNYLINEHGKDFHLVSFSGSMKSWHNIESLISVFSDLWNNNEKIKLMIIGGGDNFAELYSQYPFIIHYKNVKHDEVIELLKNSDILIAPYSYEMKKSFYFSPLKFFEYLSLNKPIITSKIGQMEEYFDDSEIFYVNPIDEEQMKHTIRYIINNKEIAQTISNKAHEKFLREFTWEKNFKKIILAIFNTTLA